MKDWDISRIASMWYKSGERNMTKIRVLPDIPQLMIITVVDRSKYWVVNWYRRIFNCRKYKKQQVWSYRVKIV